MVRKYSLLYILSTNFITRQILGTTCHNGGRTISDIPIEPFDSEEESRKAGKIVHKMLRKKVIGGHKKQVDTIKNWFATDEQGLVEDLIEVMVAKPRCPVRAYGGGHRSNVQLTDYEDAKEFAEKRGWDTDWF